MNTNVLSAVFRRNLISYFDSITGYLFICVFVCASAGGAFWSSDFFSANLATLDQLNRWIPFILLFFVPAISMSIWADESRQGTDELLLTIPASDFEIVLGKYLAALAIFTVSLVFSGVSNYLVLGRLGEPDVGLFIATYAGYWFLGLAMLAIGMVGSFLTRNLTVAYILGALLNFPLAGLAWAENVPNLDRKHAMLVRQWSFSGQFDEFGRGIVGFSGIAYFLLIVVVMLYLCMVLIGRRHWVRSGTWHAQAGHFLVRAAAMGLITAGVVYFLHNHDVRLDATSEKLSALSPTTLQLIDDLKQQNAKGDAKRPLRVRIEAFVSPTSEDFPESYVQTRLNLLTTLREMKARAGDLVELQVYEPERAGKEADLAKKRYNIISHEVDSLSRGTYKRDHVFMGVAFTCGLEKVILPFVDRGIPVEYELVRSLCTVTQQKRTRLGIVDTDAPLFGKFSMQGPSPNWRIVSELQKQYDVVQVNPTQPIPPRKLASKPGDKEEGFDVLLVVQPSAMGPPELENLIAAIRSGIPTVVFEDPFTFFAPGVPGTSQPRRPPDQMSMMFNRQPLNKGKIGPLWKMLGISFSGSEADDEFPIMGDDELPMGGGTKIVWQGYNPYPKLHDIPSEFVFLDSGCGNPHPFNDNDAISSKLQNLLFPGPGYIEERNTSELGDTRNFVPLIKTSGNSGTVRASEMVTASMFGQSINPMRRQIPGNGAGYILAAHISGTLSAPKEDLKSADAKAGKDAKDAKPAAKGTKINVVVVADIDMLTDQFFDLRERGEQPGMGLHFDFDNVTFVLNALDSLAGDERFLDLRKRRPKHRTLTGFDRLTEDARNAAAVARDSYRKDNEAVTKKEEEKFNAEIKKIEENLKSENTDENEAGRKLTIAVRDAQRRLDDTKKELEEKRNEKIDEANAKLDADIHRLQGRYKLLAVVLPPIPPLLLGCLVFFIRRGREGEGVSKNRLR